MPLITSLSRVLVIAAVVLGIAARVVDFDQVPPGLNQDEASIGYEAWSLLHDGIDRNGLSWPVHLISWGSGQNALYAYAAMPLIVVFGLSVMTTRLPMLVMGLLSLGLTWFSAHRLFGKSAAWGATSLLALSPWHIMLSRWSLESNILPFVFLGGLACLVFGITPRRWPGDVPGEIQADRALRPPRPLSETEATSPHEPRLAQPLALVASGALLGLCLYAYGTAYLAVPIFTGLALGLGLLTRRLTGRGALLMLAAFVIVATPIALFIAVNTFKLSTIVIAGVSIPRMPVTPRFETQLAEGPLAHAGQLGQLLLTQRDGTVYNVTDPYGVMYSVVFFALAILLAIVTMIFVAARRWPPQRMLIVLWLVACLPTGIVQEPNINRINLLLAGLVVASGIGLGVLALRLKGALVAGLSAALVLFGFFAHDYFTTQPGKIAPEFFAGLTPALARAQAVAGPSGPVCVTGNVNMPYIFALFTERTDPHVFTRTVHYVDPAAPFRDVSAFGRYTFGLDRCDYGQAWVVVARDDKDAASVPDLFRKDQSFGLFSVYVRR